MVILRDFVLLILIRNKNIIISDDRWWMLKLVVLVWVRLPIQVGRWCWLVWCMIWYHLVNVSYNAWSVRCFTSRNTQLTYSHHRFDRRRFLISSNETTWKWIGWWFQWVCCIIWYIFVSVRYAWSQFLIRFCWRNITNYIYCHYRFDCRRFF